MRGRASIQGAAVAAKTVIARDHRNAVAVDAVQVENKYLAVISALILGHAPAEQDRLQLCTVVGIRGGRGALPSACGFAAANLDDPRGGGKRHVAAVVDGGSFTRRVIALAAGPSRVVVSRPTSRAHTGRRS